MPAFAVAVNHNRRKPQKAPPPDVPPDALPPLGLLADLMNARGARESRIRMGDENYRLHVSELIRVKKSERFCPREHALYYFDRREYAVGSLSPGTDLLFATGHAIHEHVRNRWLARSALAHLAWGVWKCRCGHTSRDGQRPVALVCTRCKRPVDRYHEIELLAPNQRLVGHPDFLIKWGPRLYIYEIKTIDRADVIFDDLHAPLGDHTLQGSFYYWMLRGMGHEVSPAVRYLYVDRSTSKMWSGLVYKEFKQKASDRTRLDPFLKMADTLAVSIKTKTLPPRICTDPTEARAKGCKVAVLCFNRRGNKIAAP